MAEKKAAGKAIKKTASKTTKQVKEVEMEFSSTLFDDVYRTIVSRMPQFIIPVINDAFGTRYPMNVPFEQLKNEFYRKGGKIVTDSIFLIEGHIYHVECQSNPDNTMAIRMFEYGLEIAIERARKNKDYLHVDLPESAVIYLRHTAETPDTLTVEVSAPNGQTLDYESKVIKVQEYTKDVIFRKKLLMYLPFYIMRYENELKTIDKDKKRLESLLKEYVGICAKLEKALEDNGESELYSDLVGYILEIVDYMLRTQENARKEMNKMGGKILESFTEKTERNGKLKVANAVKDIGKGINSAELKKKYDAETIKIARDTIKIAKSMK